MSEENLPQPDPDKKLTSDTYDAFCEALDMLYIPGNLGGRINFLKKYPAAAAYIFGEALIAFDTDGAEDKERRAVLEQEAILRHEKLQEIARTLEEKSAVKGVLQSEYVETVVRDMGRELALLLYAPRFVDKIFPPPAPEPEEVAPAPEPTLPPPTEPPPPADANEVQIRPIFIKPKPSPDEGQKEAGPMSYADLLKQQQGDEEEPGA